VTARSSKAGTEPRRTRERGGAWILAALLVVQGEGGGDESPYDRVLLRRAPDWSGAVLVEREGRALWLGGYGFADFEADLPNGADTRFDLGPLTQVFTAAAVLRLEQEGLLTLDQRLELLLPGIPPHSGAVTLRQLLAHTSGIQGGTEPSPQDDESVAVLRLLGRGPAVEPGTRRQPWSGGYGVLAGVVSHVSRRPFTSFVQDLLLGPAGMRDSGFTLGAEAAPLALGHSGGRALRRAGDPVAARTALDAGTTGLVSSARDLLTWCKALDQALPLDQAHAQALVRPQDASAPLVWEPGRAADGGLRLRLGGTAPGFASEMRTYPAHDATIAVLANDDQADVAAVCADLEDLLLGRPRHEAAEREGIPRAEGTACAGAYVCDAGRLVVRAAPGVLLAGVEGSGLLARLGLQEDLAWKPDFPALERRAFAIVDALSRGDTRPVREAMAPRLPRGWPDLLRSRIWAAHVEIHGAYLGARPLGTTTRENRVEVLLALEHENGPARALAVFGPAGLEALEWSGPEFPAVMQLERQRRGIYRLPLAERAGKLEFALEEERAPSLRWGALTLQRTESGRER